MISFSTVERIEEDIYHRLMIMVAPNDIKKMMDEMIETGNNVIIGDNSRSMNSNDFALNITLKLNADPRVETSKISMIATKYMKFEE